MQAASEVMSSNRDNGQGVCTINPHHTQTIHNTNKLQIEPKSIQIEAKTTKKNNPNAAAGSAITDTDRRVARRWGYGGFEEEAPVMSGIVAGVVLAVGIDWNLAEKSESLT